MSTHRYWAFISYSQRDTKWAQWLHKQLETYHVPRTLVGRRHGNLTVPKRLVPVFRDRDELPSTGNLDGKIREALAASRSLIVICSVSPMPTLQFMAVPRFVIGSTITP